MIKVENLSKVFGLKRAVDDVSFEVHPGEVLGFLGPNGAGKSTTMRMITGFIPPTAGRITVCGHDMLAGAITPGALSSFVFYAILAASSAGAISEVIGDLQRDIHPGNLRFNHAAHQCRRVISLRQMRSYQCS